MMKYHVVQLARPTCRGRVASLALLVLLVTTLAACGESGASAPRRDAGDLATARARSGDAWPTDTPQPPTATATTPPTATAALTPTLNGAGNPLLADGLLRRDALRGMWTNSNETLSGNFGFCGIPDAVMSTGDHAATITYSSTGGQFVYEWLSAEPGVDPAATMERLRENWSCQRFTTESPASGTLLWETYDQPFAQVGDDTFVRRFRLTYANPVYDPREGYLVVIQRNAYIATILHIGFATALAESEMVAEQAVLAIDRLPANGPDTR